MKCLGSYIHADVSSPDYDYFLVPEVGKFAQIYTFIRAPEDIAF